MKIKAFLLNAFAKTEQGGNPAGVVPDADHLSEKQMLALAREIGFSETAFISKSDRADVKVRFFTPLAEVDLCGHATIAAFSLLVDQKTITPGKYTQETKAGVLAIELLEDGNVFMDQKLPEYFDIIDTELISDSLNISPEVIRNDLPVQIVSTGLRDIFVPIRSLTDLFQIQPDFLKVREASRKFQVIGYHLFSLETRFGSTAHCRNLAPLYDIDEEAATGTSSGALSCYLFKYGIIQKDQIRNLVFEQGYSMNRPSEIKAKLELIDDQITAVRVGGTSANIREAMYNVSI